MGMIYSRLLSKRILVFQHILAIARQKSILKPVRTFILNTLPRNVNINDDYDLVDYLLCVAIEENNFQVVCCCLDSNSIDINMSTDELQNTLLHNAIQMKQVDANIIELLLAYGADVNKENLNNETSIFALFYRTNNRSPESKLMILKILIDANVNVNKQDRYGFTPLQCLIRMLLRRVDFTFEQMQLAVYYLFYANASRTLNVQNTSGQTTLHLACYDVSRTGPLASLFLTFGADPKLVDNFGRTALHYAAMDSENMSIVQILHYYGAEINAKDNFDRTPLYELCVQSKYDDARIIPFITLLVKLGAYINCRAIDKTTALHLAAEKFNVTICQAFVELGANINSRDYLNRTPLHFAARNPKSDVARMLIDHGADVDIPDQRFSTPAHYAVMLNNLNVLKVILEHHVN